MPERERKPEPREPAQRKVDAARSEPEPAPRDREYCPQCGRVLRSHRCKLVCECGYFMSCSEF